MKEAEKERMRKTEEGGEEGVERYEGGKKEKDAIENKWRGAEVRRSMK